MKKVENLDLVQFLPNPESIKLSQGAFPEGEVLNSLDSVEPMIFWLLATIPTYGA